MIHDSLIRHICEYGTKSNLFNSRYDSITRIHKDENSKGDVFRMSEINLNKSEKIIYLIERRGVRNFPFSYYWHPYIEYPLIWMYKYWYLTYNDAAVVYEKLIK